MKITPVVALMVLILPCRGQTAAKSSRSEQTHFSAEDERVQHPIKIPQSVLAVIDEDENMLSASEIHLAGSTEKDIVVMAVGLLRGANITTFWVLRPTDRGFEMLLDAPVHDLIVKNSRSSGYRDIELLSATAVTVSTVLVKFDGKKYQTYKSKSKPIR
jgi:hypothetical protein